MDHTNLDRWHMRRALELAARGQGHVEPNPLVGCVIARGAEVIGEGWHRRFGGPHAEVEALTVAGDRAAGGTLYVTLEPCCHHGKTPPCTRAVLAAGVRRVVAASRDPYPAVAGAGIAELRAAGIEVDVGVEEAAARRLNAPYLKLVATDRPWVIAKWAMTLDGKLATRTGDSRWISGDASRAIVHELRGRVDAIVVGSRTAAIDDPLLTARPAGPRRAVRIVIDRRAAMASDCQLVRTAREVPVLVAASDEASAADRQRLESAGCEVLVLPGLSHAERLVQLWLELGRRRMTNVLVEGGSQLLGALFDARHIDEVHVFVAPKVAGGQAALGPLSGVGVARISEASTLSDLQWRQVESDLYVHGRWTPPAAGVPAPG